MIEKGFRAKKTFYIILTTKFLNNNKKTFYKQFKTLKLISKYTSKIIPKLKPY